MCITKEDVLKVVLSMYPKSIYYAWITKKSFKVAESMYPVWSTQEKVLNLRCLYILSKLCRLLS